MLEQKLEKSHFVRVDSDVVDNLIRKEDKKADDLTAAQRNILTNVFRSQIPAVDKAEFLVSFESLSADAAPLVITQNEYMRRMKDMAAMQPGMSFYSELPDSYNLIVNTEHKLIKQIRDDADKSIAEKISPITSSIDKTNAEITTIREAAKDGKLSDDDNKKVSELEGEADKLRKEETEMIGQYAATQPVVKQLIDLALLGNGLLKGHDLREFIKRSINLL